jgi:hypothetical protein
VIDLDLSLTSLLGAHVKRRADKVAALSEAFLSFKASEAKVENLETIL